MRLDQADQASRLRLDRAHILIWFLRQPTAGKGLRPCRKGPKPNGYLGLREQEVGDWRL